MNPEALEFRPAFSLAAAVEPAAELSQGRRGRRKKAPKAEVGAREAGAKEAGGRVAALSDERATLLASLAEARNLPRTSHHLPPSYAFSRLP